MDLETATQEALALQERNARENTKKAYKTPIKEYNEWYYCFKFKF